MQANDRMLPRSQLAWFAVMNQKARGSRLRPGYIFDNHKKLVQELFSILDQAAVEYDHSEDLVDDFTAYLKDWANQRDQER